MSKQLKVPGANGFLAGPGVGSAIGGTVGDAVEDEEDVGVAEESVLVVVVVRVGCCDVEVCAFTPMRSMVAISAIHVVGRSRILCILVH